MPERGYLRNIMPLIFTSYVSLERNEENAHEEEKREKPQRRKANEEHLKQKRREASGYANSF